MIRIILLPALAAVVTTALFALSQPAMALPPLPEGWTSTLNRDHPLAGKIWSVADKAFVTREMLAADITSARFVLAGETHDNPDHHLRQAWIVKALAEAGRKPAVVFEMIPADYGSALSAYLDAHPQDASGLGDALDWAERGWPAWSMYRPIADAALAANLTMATGDIGRDTLKRFRGEGLAAFGTGEAKRLGLETPLPATASQTLRQDLVESHCGLLPPKAVEAMLPVQRARDAMLAEGMIANGTADGAVLIAGAGHVRADMAAPWYLYVRAPEASVRIVAMMEAQDGETDPAAYLPAPGAYDYVWFTAKTEREDPCTKLREQFGKKG